MDPLHRAWEKFVDVADELYTAVLCGAMAGTIAKTAVAPAERVKMSFQTSRDRFTLRDALRRGARIVNEEGVIWLWRGHSTTIVRVAPYAGLSYAIHDITEKELKYRLNTETLPFAYKFLAGSIAGAGATLLTYPLDVLRVRLALIPGSTWSSILKQGGLYQGLRPTLYGIIPYSGTSWCIKQVLLERFMNAQDCAKCDRKAPHLFESLIINGIAGLSGQFVTYPLDIARRRMQLHPTSNTTTSAVLMDLYRTEGWRGLSKGFSLNIIKGPITLSISFTSYDLLKKMLDGQSEV